MEGMRISRGPFCLEANGSLLLQTREEKYDVFLFSSHQDRDQFYEAFWFARKGQYRVRATS